MNHVIRERIDYREPYFWLVSLKGCTTVLSVTIICRSMLDRSQFTRRCSRVRKVLCSEIISQGNDSYICIFTSLITSGPTILHKRPTFLQDFPIFLASE